MMTSQRQFTEQRFTVPWGHIAAKVYGSSLKNRVLLVHGVMDNAGSFERLLPLLPKEYQYVCIDMPGHGLSSPFPPGVPLSFFDYVHAIKMVLDALKWERCVLISHSLGTFMCLYFSILYPERTQKLVCLDGIVSTPIADERVIDVIREIYNPKDNQANRTYTKEQIFHALQFRRHASLNPEAAQALFTRAVTKVGDMYMYNRDLRLKSLVSPLFSLERHLVILRRMSVPTLLISAEGSHNRDIIQRVARYIELHVKDVFLHVSIPGNHDVHNNNPERVAPHICAFLQNDIRSKL